MLLENPQKASTSEPDQMGICLNSRLRAKTRVHKKYVRDLLFAMMQPLQLTLRRTFSGFWTTFQMLVDTLDLPSAWQNHRSWGKTLRRYHRSSFTITDNLSIDSELNKRIGKAAMTLSKLTKRVWSNNKLSDHTKVNVYKTCVISILLYGSESWTMHAH